MLRKVHNIRFGATTSKCYGSILNKELWELFTILKVLTKKLKETNRIDMADDIEDAEFIIANYEKNVGV